MADPLLIATADIHLCENAPSFRSGEPDWFEAQRRQLRWLGELSKQLNAPIVVAGDIFDKAVGSTRLVNFVADEFPVCYAVAGNHDLPYHDFQNVRYSSYGNLIRTGKINDIDGVIKFQQCGITIALHGFPFGSQFRPCIKYADLDIAVVHEFIWNGVANSFLTNLLSSAHISVRKKDLPGYDFYIFGDNHGPFIEDNVINCGSFYRRMKYDVDYVPSVAVIYSDGTIERVSVPIDKDVITLPSIKLEQKVKKGEKANDFDDFLDSLKTAESFVCDADSILKDYLQRNQVDTDVMQAIVDITESRDSRVRPK